MLQRLATIVLKSGVSLGGLTIDDRNLALAIPARVLPLDVVVREAQVNAALKACLDGEGSFLATDHVELRRWLVDTGWWRRDGFGHRYERVPGDALPAALRGIDAALNGIDPAPWVQMQREAARDARDRRRQAWAQRQAAVR